MDNSSKGLIAAPRVGAVTGLDVYLATPEQKNQSSTIYQFVGPVTISHPLELSTFCMCVYTYLDK